MIRLVLLVASIAALAIGCAPSAPAKPNPAVPLSQGRLSGTPALAFDKRQVELGTLAQDQQTTQAFLAFNMGEMPLKVGPVSVQVEQGCDVAEAFVKGTDELKSNEAGLVFVKVGPHRKLGDHRLVMNVSSNDATTPVTKLSMSFTVAESAARSQTGPRLRVDKDVIDIGTVPNDWPLYEEYTLRNEGDAPLILGNKLEARVEEGC